MRLCRSKTDLMPVGSSRTEWYKHFPQVTDAEVLDLLERARTPQHNVPVVTDHPSRPQGGAPMARTHSVGASPTTPEEYR